MKRSRTLVRCSGCTARGRMCRVYVIVATPCNDDRSAWWTCCGAHVDVKCAYHGAR